MKILFEKYRFWLNCWGIVFAILGLVFSFYMITFYVGNHDWQYMRSGVKFTNGFWEGRLTQFLLPVVLLHSQVLPILGIIAGFLFFSGGSVLLAKWYHFPEKYIPVLSFSLLIVLNPYVCSQLYYVHSVISVLCWHLLSIVGVICAGRFADNLKIKWLVAAILCLWLALAGYVPSLELMLALVMGKFLVDIMVGAKFDMALIKRYIILGGIIGLSVGGYVFAIYLLKKAHILFAHMYNVQTMALKDVLKLLVDEWRAPFNTFFMEIPFISIKINYLFVLLGGLFFWVAYQKKRLILSTLGLIGLFYAAFVLAYLSPYGIFKAMRIHCFSIPYIAAIVFAVVWINTHKFKRNLTLFTAFVLVLLFLKADFMIEKVWYLGTEQDERMVDRVRARLIPELNLHKHYRLSSVGSFYGRQKFAGFNELSTDVREIYREYYGYGLYLYCFFSTGLFLYEKENPIWSDIVYLGNYVIFTGSPVGNIAENDSINAYLFNQHFGDDRNDLIAAADKLCAYPCKNFYYIGEKDILLMVSDDNLSRLVLKWNIENEGKIK